MVTKYNYGMYLPLCDDTADYYGTSGYCFSETSLVKHIPEYDVMLLRCYVAYRSGISHTII